MALEVSQMMFSLDEALSCFQDARAFKEAVAKKLSLEASEIKTLTLLKRSLDARKKHNIHYVVSCKLEFKGSLPQERQFLLKAKKGVIRTDACELRVKKYEEQRDLFSDVPETRKTSSKYLSPVIAGSGPAGLMCALYLAKAGLKPIVLERGSRIEERQKSVGGFEAGGRLDPRNNIQFGEGGAGTFSDGKLSTGIKSPFFASILRCFVRCGAPEDILWQSKPHIGTDYLPAVIRNLRVLIESLGGEFRFNTTLSALRFEGGRLIGAEVQDSAGEPARVSFLETDRVVLACGHSARDTFEMLAGTRIALQQKAFSMGVRIEHLQSSVNFIQYGAFAKHPSLPPADYKIATHTLAGRGVYSFCMCPGGQVVAATSEKRAVCTNGMSTHARDGKNANAALLVEVRPGDFGSDDVLAGMNLARSIEQKAFALANRESQDSYRAPAQTLGDFMHNISGNPSDELCPSYSRGVSWVDLHVLLPDFVSSSLTQALEVFGLRMPGFVDPQAVLTAPETRSSSPVRILRGKDFQARILPHGVALPADVLRIGIEAICEKGCGVYPCGEGAGYAGGIMSACADGIRVAMALCASY